MAYWIDYTKSYMPTRQLSYECDTADDISNLPTSSSEGVPQSQDSTCHLKVKWGSSCLCLGSSEVYKLNSHDQWVAI